MPYAWQVPMTRPRWPSGSRAFRRPTQPWPGSQWSSACQGPPGSSWHPPQSWRSHPHPHPRATSAPWPTREQVVGELPVQPVLQHQEQSELRRRRQESVVGSGSAPSLFSRTRCLCRRQPHPTPSSRASAPGPRSSPGYTASGSPAGKMQAKVIQRLDLNLWQQG